MGKDKEGSFHPTKGKPSGTGHKKGIGTHEKDAGQLEKQVKIEDEYQIGDDQNLEIPGIHTRHHNRNEDKGRDRSQPDSRRRSVATTITDANEIKRETSGHERSVNSQSFFFVLILSKKQAKFFRGDQSGFTQIEVSELPNGIEDVVHLEEKNGQNLFRTGSSGAGGGANYHGMGSGQPDDKENISMYLKEVDRTLWKEFLNKASAPLILGGVDYIVSMYKDITQYKNIVDQTLSGSLENEERHKIYKRAKELVNPFIA
ncbi:MAG TPA: hypothetical protein VK508_14885 [Cyclobacteriaceae bacterium]|nr:hypothetical protein [Cyclobacteriaceae bacterium]